VTSIILCTATRYLMPLMLLFSVFLLLRGHNEPGGGFIAGLVAAGAFALYAIAFNVAEARRALKLDPRTFIGLGLLISASSGVLSLLGGAPFMTGQWGDFYVPLLGHIHLGTPLVFDVGVYSVVIGVTLTIILALGEEE